MWEAPPLPAPSENAAGALSDASSAAVQEDPQDADGGAEAAEREVAAAANGRTGEAGGGKEAATRGAGGWPLPKQQ